MIAPNPLLATLLVILITSLTVGSVVGIFVADLILQLAEIDE